MMDGITQTRVDGVPAVLASRAGNRIAAGLLFRVGRADETLATSGITHLVEHLALHEHGVGDLHYNGATADLYTHFHVEGSAAHVAEYFEGVCRALADLPLHRLETEKEILRTEAAGRGLGPAPKLAMFRYGAQGFGLSSYLEVGLPRLDGATVADWARTHFTRENAVFWMTSETVPEGLRLNLPQGRRNPVPTVTSALPETPAWYRSGEEVVYLNAVVTRSTAATVYARVLAKALWRDLRQQGGFSYTAAADYVPRDRDSALVMAMADCLPEKREAVIGGFVDTLARLRVGRVTDVELKSAKDALMHQFDESELASKSLPGYAVNLLIGHDNLSLETIAEEIENTTADDVRRVATEVHDSALVQVPALGLDWAGFTAAPEFSESRVSGRSFPSLDQDGTALVVGPSGVSITLPEDRQATVLYREVVAMQAYPDGARALTGRDGFHVTIEPTIHRVDAAALQAIDAGVPPTSVVQMPPRAADRIPQPQPQRTAERMDPHQSTSKRLVSRVLFGTMALLLVLFVAVAIDMTTRAAQGADEEGLVGGAIMCWAISGFLAYRMARNWRRRHPRPKAS